MNSAGPLGRTECDNGGEHAERAEKVKAGMRYLDLTLPTPAENLACDEALLDWCDAGGPETLRFWEPSAVFVVVGYANSVASEVHVEICERDGIPVLRRVSGGGTVLQAPGCLNYTLILRVDADPALASIDGTNRFILERHCRALGNLIEGPGPRAPSGGRRVERCGDTDLALDGLKCSGNAQRRRQRALLFHGTFLLQADLGLIERFLPLPSRQPPYRAGRAHRDFLTNLGVPAPMLKDELRTIWQASDPLTSWPRREVDQLVRERYAMDAWNRKM